MSSSRSPSPDYDQPSRGSTRQTSVRLSSRNTHSGVARNFSVRTRPPTPVASSRRRRNANSTPASASPPPPSSQRRRRSPVSPRADLSDDDASSLVVDGGNTSAGRHQRHRPQQQRTGGPRLISRSHEYVVSSSGNYGQRLAWYERILPECVLAMSSPITGYETRLEADVDDEEYAILERERIRRNRRIRRRIATLLLVAGAASAVMYLANGRLFRRAAVKAGVNSFKHRLEDGLTRTIHDTLGK